MLERTKVCVFRTISAVILKTLPAEILLHEGLVTVYRQWGDVTVFVSGGREENELFLFFVLCAIGDALTEIAKCVELLSL